jgi:hypothetical protein
VARLGVDALVGATLVFPFVIATRTSPRAAWAAR